ncbi:hypothetical protein WN944_018724 [Citrus x changshan-huyou]|uniref:Uncharacterized protein n=1 Tax=Citrus x changshan-huyou TaxID=2935761 RepID=A0AAP0LWU9_9ROSI
MISLENSLDKSSPPPLENDRSTKKAKFRQQGEDGDNPPVFTFRDKLLESQYGVEGKEKIQDTAKDQNGNSNKGSRFGVLLDDDDDGGNNQNEGNESSVAILSSSMPTTTAPHVVNISEDIAAKKTSFDPKIVAKKSLRVQN